MTRWVSAPARLHFGLFAAGGQFGGCGLMVQSPRVTVTGEPDAAGWSATGPLGERALRFALMATGTTPADTPGWRLTADGPPEHVGLGVGTALGLAVARLISLTDPFAPSADEQARRVGRGQRSGIGLHGFRAGGFLVDAGKPTPDALPQLAGRSDFPPGWRVVLVRPRAAERWAGGREQAAFDRPRPLAAAGLLDSLARDALLPAVRAGDFRTFAAGLGEYNRLAGEPFAADQGGEYAGEQVTTVVETVRSWGFAGVGQSSWGPTVFAVCPDGPTADRLADRCRRLSDIEDVTVTAADNIGAMSGVNK